MNIVEQLNEIKKYVLNLSNETPEEVETVVTPEEVATAPVEDLTEVKEETPKYVTESEFATAMDELKSLFSKQYEAFKSEKDNLETKNLELSKQLDEKPDAEKIVTAPVEKVELTATTKKGSIYQFLNNRK